MLRTQLGEHMKLFMKSKAYRSLGSDSFIAGENNIVNSNIVVMPEPVSDTLTITTDFVKMYLSTKGCVLWQQWDITSEDGLDSAAIWLVNEIESLVSFVVEAISEDTNDQA